MELSSLQAIRSVVDPLKIWTPQAIPFASGEVDINGAPVYINLMDFIGAECKKKGQIVRFEQRSEWSRFEDKQSRAVLIREIVNACAKAGFSVSYRVGKTVVCV